MTPAEVRAARSALGLTQAQLAQALGIAVGTVVRWERDDGTHQPPAFLALALEALSG